MKDIIEEMLKPQLRSKYPLFQVEPEPLPGTSRDYSTAVSSTRRGYLTESQQEGDEVVVKSSR